MTLPGSRTVRTRRRAATGWRALLLLLGILLIAFVPPVSAAPPPRNDDWDPDLLKRLALSSVKLQVSFIKGEEEVVLRGSGVFITYKSFTGVLTVADLVTPPPSYQLLVAATNGRSLDYTRTARLHPALGLALLELDLAGEPAVLARASALREGTSLVLISSPRTEQHRLDFGRLGPPMAIPEGAARERALLSAKVTAFPGSVGGGIWNRAGELLGIVLPTPDRDLPILDRVPVRSATDIRTFLEQIVK